MRTQEKKIRTIGRGARACRRCKTHKGIIRRADLMICRRCMREIAKPLGFSKTGARGG